MITVEGQTSTANTPQNPTGIKTPIISRAQFSTKKSCQIPPNFVRASSQNSAAHCDKIVQIARLTIAFHLCIN